MIIMAFGAALNNLVSGPSRDYLGLLGASWGPCGACIVPVGGLGRLLLHRGTPTHPMIVAA